MLRIITRELLSLEFGHKFVLIVSTTILVNSSRHCAVEAAIEAVEHGASAIMVSNHGGRQLDCVPATVSCLNSKGAFISLHHLNLAEARGRYDGRHNCGSLHNESMNEPFNQSDIIFTDAIQLIALSGLRFLTKQAADGRSVFVNKACNAIILYQDHMVRNNFINSKPSSAGKFKSN